ncbi:MAG TPA: Gmad2 immunoglobulin-like domain-containing protein [Gaiellaceae bacterium]|nr:Gmad2 immunoglobulin-like domain-containing protein [Gaiellaceae bacterium]
MRFLVVAASCCFLIVAVSACGSDEKSSPAGGTVTQPPAETTDPPAVTGTVPEQAPTVVTLYFLRDGKLGVAAGFVPSGPRIATAAVNDLLEGPTASDRAAGLSSAIPRGTKLERLAIEDGVAEVALSSSLGEAATAQVVYTLTRFPTVRRVELEGEQHVRGDFEDVTPPILVESPAPGEEVSSPLRIKGTANTFEATFQVEVLGADRRVVGKRFVTATSGSGTRGTFDANVPFSATGGRVTLAVFELSAEDGSRIHEVRIPLQVGPG